MLTQENFGTVALETESHLPDTTIPVVSRVNLISGWKPKLRYRTLQWSGERLQRLPLFDLLRLICHHAGVV